MLLLVFKTRSFIWNQALFCHWSELAFWRNWCASVWSCCTAPCWKLRSPPSRSAASHFHSAFCSTFTGSIEIMWAPSEKWVSQSLRRLTGGLDSALDTDSKRRERLIGEEKKGLDTQEVKSNFPSSDFVKDGGSAQCYSHKDLLKTGTENPFLISNASQEVV